jgi:predicted Zn-dependent protease
MWSDTFEVSAECTKLSHEVWQEVKSLCDERKLDIAEQVLKSAIKKYPEEESFYSTCNWLLREQKKHEEALSCAREWQIRWPESESLKANLHYSLIGQAWKYMEDKENKLALQLAREDVALISDESSCLCLGVSLNANGLYLEAIDALKKGGVDYPSNEYFRSNLNASYWSYSKELLDQKEFDKAITIFSQEENAKDILLNIYSETINYYTSERKWSDADMYSRKALEKFQEEYLYSNLNWILREQKRPEEAIEVGRNALELYPDSSSLKSALVWSLVQLAWVYLEKVKEGDPLPLAQEAIDLERNESTLLCLGCSLNHKSKYTEAVKVLKEGEEKYPLNTYFSGNVTAAFWKYAEQLISEHGYDIGIEYFTYQMRRYKPDTTLLAHVYNAKVNYLTNNKQWKQAEEVLLKATSIIKDSESLYGALLLVLKESKKLDQALTLARYASKLWPSSENIKNHLTWILVDLSWNYLAKFREKVEDEVTNDPLPLAEEALSLYRNEWTCLCHAASLRPSRRYRESLFELLNGEKEYPENKAYRENVKYTLNLWNNYLTIRERFSEFEDTFRALVQEFPDDIDIKQTLASCLVVRSGFLKQEKHPLGEVLSTEADRLNREFMNSFEQRHPNRKRLTSLALPMKGYVYVVAGFDQGGTHCGSGKYSYDFVTINPDTKSTLQPGTDGTKNEDHLCFGEPVYAVLDGIVSYACDTHPDHSPPLLCSKPSNHVSIKHQDGFSSEYEHIKQHSVTVKVGQTVKKGDVIGHAGNTGYSGGPHLHFSMNDSEDGHTIFCQFEKMNIYRTINSSETIFSDEQYQVGYTILSL